MRARQLVLSALLVPLADPAAAQVTVDDLVREALALLPVEARAGARLIVRHADREEVLRDGSNAYVCTTTAPSPTGFAISCHHRTLEPMLGRERALVRQGLEPAAVRATLTREAAEGRLALPERAHQVTAGASIGADGRPGYVAIWHFLYMPYVEGDEIGVTTSRAAESYLHNPGTYDAHVMWQDTSVPFGSRSATVDWLEVAAGGRTRAVALGDTIRLAAGDTAVITPYVHDEGLTPRDPASLWWHDTAGGLLRFLAPLPGGRYAAAPGRVIAATPGASEVMLHWEAVAGGSVFVPFVVTAR